MKIKSSTDAYNELGDLGIKVSPAHMRNRVALIGPDGYLNIDYSKITSEKQELALLIEEIGHYGAYAFYTPNATIIDWAREEHRARRWAFEEYYSPAALAALMATTCPDVWQLAEHLNLPEPFLHEILYFYQQVRGVNFNALIEELTNNPPAPEEPVQDEPQQAAPPSLPEEPAPASRALPNIRTLPPLGAKVPKSLRLARGQLTNTWY